MRDDEYQCRTARLSGGMGFMIWAESYIVLERKDRKDFMVWYRKYQKGNTEIMDSNNKK
jgi:hypothetical protein